MSKLTDKLKMWFTGSPVRRGEDTSLRHHADPRDYHEDRKTSENSLR